MLLCHFVHFDKFISHIRIAVLDFINGIRIIFCQLHCRRYGACRVLICCSNNEILLHITNLSFDRAKFSKLLLFGFDAFVGVNLIKKFQILLIVFVGRLRFFEFLTFLLILQLNQFHLIALHFEEGLKDFLMNLLGLFGKIFTFTLATATAFATFTGAGIGTTAATATAYIKTTTAAIKTACDLTCDINTLVDDILGHIG